MQFRSKMIPIAGAIAFALTGSAYAQEQVIKIGHTGPLSGPNAFAGKDDENGLRHGKCPVNQRNRMKING